MAAYAACAEHVRSESKFGNVMHKMLMGLVASTVKQKIAPMKTRTNTPVKPVLKLVLTDVESDDEADTLKMVRSGGRSDSERMMRGSAVNGVNEVNVGSDMVDLSEYVLN